MYRREKGRAQRLPKGGFGRVRTAGPNNPMPKSRGDGHTGRDGISTARKRYSNQYLTTCMLGKGEIPAGPDSPAARSRPSAAFWPGPSLGGTQNRENTNNHQPPPPGVKTPPIPILKISPLRVRTSRTAKVKLSNYQIIKLSNYQIIKAPPAGPNYQIFKLSHYQFAPGITSK